MMKNEEYPEQKEKFLSLVKEIMKTEKKSFYYLTVNKNYIIFGTREDKKVIAMISNNGVNKEKEKENNLKEISILKDMISGAAPT
jgi:hypothetical protein